MKFDDAAIAFSAFAFKAQGCTLRAEGPAWSKEKLSWIYTYVYNLYNNRLTYICT